MFIIITIFFHFFSCVVKYRIAYNYVEIPVCDSEKLPACLYMYARARGTGNRVNMRE